MSNFLAKPRRPAIPVVILTRRPYRRDPDVLSLVISGAFLMFAITYSLLKAMEFIQ